MHSKRQPPNDMSWITTGTYDLRYASKALEWWQDVDGTGMSPQVQNAYREVGLKPGVLDERRGFDRRNIKALETIYDWFGNAYLDHQNVPWLVAAHIAGSVVLANVGTVSVTGRGSYPAQTFVAGARSIFESMGTGAVEYVNGGTASVTNSELRRAFGSIDAGDERRAFDVMVAYEQGDEVLQGVFNSMPVAWGIAVTVGAWYNPVYCPLTTCEKTDDVSYYGANYLDLDTRMRWLRGSFAPEFFEMRDKDRKTFRAWMRTPASQLGRIIARTHGTKGTP